MLIRCPNCNEELELPQDSLGAKVKCAECGEKFIASALQRLIDAECPHCHADYEVSYEELGSTVMCERCRKQFIVEEKKAPRRQIADMTTSELSQRVAQIRESSKTSDNPDEISSLRVEVVEIKKLIAQRYETVRARAINKVMDSVPFMLRPFSSLFVRFRVIPKEELCIKELMERTSSIIKEMTFRANNLIRLQRERQQIIAEKERKQKESAERKARIAQFVDDITKCVRTIHENKSPDPIRYDHFSYQPDEVAYLVQKNVPCVVPHQKKCEKYCGGTFVITNKRIVYMTELHMQTYTMKTLRDFEPSWRLDAGWITIATASKRKERFKLETAWLPTLLILFFANDVFREMLLTQDVRASVEYIWDNKIMSTQSPLHFRLLNIPFEDRQDIFGTGWLGWVEIKIGSDTYRDGSYDFANKREYEKHYNDELKKCDSLDGRCFLIDHMTPPERMITLEDKLSGRWDDMLAMSTGIINKH